MSQTLLMHDGAISSFESVDSAGITVDDDGEATFTWDEVPIVKVDAPSDLEGAFDTERFYKIEGATIARPIKQPYHVGDDVETYKKPADELRRAAWSFDNAPFTLGHPDTGMVKDVNDVHGFWKNPRYLDDDERLNADLYIPETDEGAREFVAENQDVSVGFFNRVHREYDGDTGDLTDEEGVDGYQVDIYGNHVAGVERGRCPSEQGCGLDSMHGQAVMATKTQEAADTSPTMEQTTDQPSGIHVADGTWFAVGPGEHTKDSTEYADNAMFPVDSCSDIDDAWGLRGHTDNLTIEQSTLAERIKRAAEAKDCDVPGEESQDALESLDTAEGYHPWKEVEDSDNCECTDTTMDENDFDIPDLSIDALAEQNDQVSELKSERDEYEEALDEMRDELDLDEDECPCEVVPDLAEDAERVAEMEEDLKTIKEALGLDEDDDVAERVEDIADEWQEMREDKRDDRLDTLAELGAERDEWADEPLDAMDEEIDRREEVLETVDEASPTGVEGSTDDENGDETETTLGGARRFGRGHAARPEDE